MKVARAVSCCEETVEACARLCHSGGNPWANIQSISHRCYLFEVAFVWELTKETIHLPLGCLQGGNAARSLCILCEGVRGSAWVCEGVRGCVRVCEGV